MRFKYALLLLCFSTLSHAQTVPADNALPLDLIELLGELDSDMTTLDIAMTKLLPQKTTTQKTLIKPAIAKSPAGGENNETTP